MRGPRGLVIGVWVAATFATGIAAVWLTGDARAFGVVVMLAAVVAGIVLEREKVLHVLMSLYTDDHHRRRI